MPAPAPRPAPDSARLAAIRRALLGWYRRNARALPWRRNRDPYRVWVSEIMLQQTRVEAAAPYYLRFLRAFPTVRALARAPEERVLKLWEGLGYYSRARNLHRAAKLVAGERRGRFPRSAEEWRALPGVGAYTAAAVASIAFGEAAAAVDANVRRVLSRIFLLEGAPGAAADRAVGRVAQALLPRSAAGDFNQALMDLGSALCVAKAPRCAACPVSRLCEAFRTGDPERVPARRRARAIPHRDVVAAAIRRGDGRILLGRRPAEAMLGGLWEFPGGKTEAGESSERALDREIREELGMRVRIGSAIGEVEHAYSHFTVTIRLFEAVPSRGKPRPLFHGALRWVAPDRIGRLALPAATRRLLPALLAHRPAGREAGGEK